jgi:hypothetical protein
MLRCRINSAKEIEPGGPVSRVAQANDTFGGAVATNLLNSSWPWQSPAKTRAKLLAGLAAIARKILQHGESLAGLGFAGAECFA